MSLDNRPQVPEPITSVDQLVAWLRAGEKPREQHRVGMEHEKIGMVAGALTPIPYEGTHGIETLLGRLGVFGYQPYLENGHAIAATRPNLSISLEPGGQLELSGSPFHCNNDLAEELSRHLALIRALGVELGQTWLAVGYRPFGTVANAQWMPKGRYGRMHAYLSQADSLGLDMMAMTATVQANYDFSDEQDMVEKVQTAQLISPLVTALFANSPLRDGKKTGDLTYRSRVWQHVDPKRCGLRPEFLAPDFGYRRYAEWALDVPMIFLRRDGAYRDPQGSTFRAFMQDGLHGERAMLSDWEDHLTTLFPEIRLKRVIEVRGADVGNARMCLALPALWKGIFYSADALESARALMPLSFGELQTFADEVIPAGLAAKAGRHRALELCKDLVEISAAGLRSQEHCGPNEGIFLDVLREELACGKTPAEETLALLDGPLNGDPTKLIEHWRMA